MSLFKLNYKLIFYFIFSVFFAKNLNYKILQIFGNYTIGYYYIDIFVGSNL